MSVNELDLPLEAVLAEVSKSLFWQDLESICQRLSDHPAEDVMAALAKLYEMGLVVECNGMFAKHHPQNHAFSYMVQANQSMVALQVDLSCEFDVEDGVYLFDSLDECLEFAIEAMVRNEWIKRGADGSLWSDDRQQQYQTSVDALDGQQEWLDSHEYFHIRQVEDLRKAVAA